jgi:predicted pyridoxine 5'-phosphate oxidase superfamily flavin-nucleotide-binding protein
MNDAIDDVAALEACIGKTPGPINLKVIDHLDEGALRWIAASRLFFAGFGDADGIGVTLGGGEPGLVRAAGPTRLMLPAAALDEPHLAAAGRGFGALFLVPGIGETLRVNGRVTTVSDAAIEIAVEECYVHCAKALIRSDFWGASPVAGAPHDAVEFLAASRFMALATIDGQGRADVSPKGDPQGTLIRLQDGSAWYADRPGNRRADSFRNVLVQPRVAIASLVVGAAHVAILSGTARVSSEKAMRESFAVGDKIPLLTTRIERPRLEIHESAALGRARLWPAVPLVDGINPAAMLAAHVRLNRTRGLQASLVRAAVSVPGLMEKGLRRDYKNNLY